MARIAYVNGRYLPQREASLNVEDRSTQFADGVYEVMKVIDGRIVDGDRHLARLGRSLAGLRIGAPVSDAVLRQLILETVRRNRLRDATVYVQVSRGVAPRDHAFPATTPSLIVTVKRLKRPDPTAYAAGVSCIVQPDIRWLRCEIKSVSLLPNVLARQAAREAGAYEAFLVRDGDVVTECSASNCYVVDEVGVLRTHPLSPLILGGVTRSVVLELASDLGIPVEERPFTLAEVATAREAMVTSTSSWVMPVVRVGEMVVGDGHPGPVTRRLQAAYHQHLFGNRAAAATVAETPPAA